MCQQEPGTRAKEPQAKKRNHPSDDPKEPQYGAKDRPGNLPGPSYESPRKYHSQHSENEHNQTQRKASSWVI